MKVNEMVKCRQCLAQSQCSYVTDDEEMGHPTLVVEPGGMSKVAASVRDRLV